MKRVEFESLKVGDIVVCKRGNDEGKKAEVVYIEDEYILIRSMPGECFMTTGRAHQRLRLTGWHELDISR